MDWGPCNIFTESALTRETLTSFKCSGVSVIWIDLESAPCTIVIPMCILTVLRSVKLNTVAAMDQYKGYLCGIPQERIVTGETLISLKCSGVSVIFDAGQLEL